MSTSQSKIKYPFGFLYLKYKEDNLHAISFKRPEDFHEQSHNLDQLCQKEITLYFDKKLKLFSIPLDLKQGTIFQRAVWKSLIKIPYGQTRSYKAISEIIKRPLAHRAVGNANNKNPFPIIIPCHRVIQNNGKLGGYAGGLKIKKHLLNLEKTTSLIKK